LGRIARASPGSEHELGGAELFAQLPQTRNSTSLLVAVIPASHNHSIRLCIPVFSRIIEAQGGGSPSLQQPPFRR
jgi:hypothetical protein